MLSTTDNLLNFVKITDANKDPYFFKQRILAITSDVNKLKVLNEYF